ncbi:hypothetical protein P167DRAFT_376621 [Morchella conica CCBAS932]|uniref:F-box domain-containing protein n=1 Tax=Morchella conica CCBAS932 TaxID=1392247 RepID=A0A3N4KHQ7_9PEZI|nr:hypothetical protein P167DRAFT_376621 [Morchella conica CCBAS932]
MESLPVELVERILSLANLSHAENLSCRLVCRGFCSIVSPTAFSRVRISKLARDAFDGIVNLSQSQLASYVVEFEYKVIRFISSKDIHDVDSLIQLSDESDTLSIQDMANSLVEHHKNHLHQVDVLGTFYDIISLSKALPAFTNLKSVTISTFDGSFELPPPLGVAEATTRAFWAVIKALNSCAYQIESFSVDSVSKLSIPPSKLAQIHEIFEGLTHLSIGSVYGQRSYNFQEDILARTPQLQTLRLGSDGRGSCEWQDILRDRIGTGHLYWPHLKVLEMDGGVSGRVTIQQKGLVRFLTSHQNTLTDLSIKRLKTFPVLRKLVLRELGEFVVADRGCKWIEEEQLLEWENLVRKKQGQTSSASA